MPVLWACSLSTVFCKEHGNTWKSPKCTEEQIYAATCIDVVGQASYIFINHILWLVDTLHVWTIFKKLKYNKIRLLHLGNLQSVRNVTMNLNYYFTVNMLMCQLVELSSKGNHPTFISVIDVSEWSNEGFTLKTWFVFQIKEVIYNSREYESAKCFL